MQRFYFLQTLKKKKKRTAFSKLLLYSFQELDCFVFFGCFLMPFLFTVFSGLYFFLLFFLFKMRSKNWFKVQFIYFFFQKPNMLLFLFFVLYQSIISLRNPFDFSSQFVIMLHITGKKLLLAMMPYKQKT